MADAAIRTDEGVNIDQGLPPHLGCMSAITPAEQQTQFRVLNIKRLFVEKRNQKDTNVTAHICQICRVGCSLSLPGWVTGLTRVSRSIIMTHTDTRTRIPLELSLRLALRLYVTHQSVR